MGPSLSQQQQQHQQFLAEQQYLMRMRRTQQLQHQRQQFLLHQQQQLLQQQHHQQQQYFQAPSSVGWLGPADSLTGGMLPMSRHAALAFADSARSNRSGYSAHPLQRNGPGGGAGAEGSGDFGPPQALGGPHPAFTATGSFDPARRATTWPAEARVQPSFFGAGSAAELVADDSARSGVLPWNDSMRSLSAAEAGAMLSGGLLERRSGDSGGQAEGPSRQS